MTESFQKYYTT